MKEYYKTEDVSIFLGDNLELLRSLPDGIVNLIYCDVLYNSGKDLDDYNDNLGTPWEAMEWYRPRIKEMHRVLAPNGSIFIHCNWRINSYLRVLLDEVFGFSNYRNRILRKHSNERGFFENFDSQIDDIYYYVKDMNHFVFNEQKSLTPICVPLFENGCVKQKSFPYAIDEQLVDLASCHKHWIVSRQELDAMVMKDEVKLVDGFPYRITYTKPIGNLWDEPEMLDQYSRTDLAEAYDTPKPEAILDRIISICSNPGDLVGDFFLGGGTTAVVAQKLGRCGVYCDINEKACKVTKKKLKNLK